MSAKKLFLSQKRILTQPNHNCATSTRKSVCWSAGLGGGGGGGGGGGVWWAVVGLLGAGLGGFVHPSIHHPLDD